MKPTRSLLPAGAASLMALACVTQTTAQQLVVLDGPAALAVEVDAPSPLVPPGAAPFPSLVFPEAPALPTIPAPIPTGGLSVDSTTGMTWYTDGLAIASTPNPRYAPIPPVPPFPAPPGLGLLTGMALDPVAGVLWITDGAIVTGIAPAPPGPIIVPPFAIAGPVAGPLTGLEWDPVTGTLWACDLVGGAYNFLPGGALVAPPVPPGAVPAPATGITVDKSGLAPFGLRSVFIAGPGIIVDAMTGLAMPTFMPAGAEAGLSFHPAPSVAPFGGAAACPCPSPGYAVGQALISPAYFGNPAFGVDVTGLPPGTIAIMAFDFLPYNPAFPLVNGLGCPFGLNFASAFGFPVLADPFGNASFPFPLAGFPLGTTFYVQNVYACPSDPAIGIGLTPMNQVIVSAP